MIEEAYVSFETAKLLKEKGFNEKVSRWYVANSPQEGIVTIGFGDKQLYINAPTQQIAMKWLREVHNLFIEPRAGETDGKTWYDFDIIPINERKIAWNHYNNLPFVECDSYEEACEAAIKYCLENLIE